MGSQGVSTKGPGEDKGPILLTEDVRLRDEAMAWRPAGKAGIGWAEIDNGGLEMAGDGKGKRDSADQGVGHRRPKTAGYGWSPSERKRGAAREAWQGGGTRPWQPGTLGPAKGPDQIPRGFFPEQRESASRDAAGGWRHVMACGVAAASPLSFHLSCGFLQGGEDQPLGPEFLLIR